MFIIDRDAVLNQIYDYVENPNISAISVNDICRFIKKAPKADVINAENVRNLYNRNLRNYVKTNNEKFLDRAMLLAEILNISENDMTNDLHKLIDEMR